MLLGYWAIRGLGQPIRLLLEYAGIPYEEKLYEAIRKEDGSIDKSGWFDEKHKLGLDFPNLPYLIDGDVKLTQTIAILQYCAEKAGMDGRTAEERAKVAMLFGLSGDVRSRYTRAAYSPEFHSMKADLIEFLHGKLGQLNRYLEGVESEHAFLVSAEITYVDLLWYDLIDQFLRLSPEILADFPSVEIFYKRIHILPQVEAYRKSDRYITKFNNTVALFK